MLDYRQAGVNILAGEKLVRWLKKQSTQAKIRGRATSCKKRSKKSSLSQRVLLDIGAYGGVFRARFPGVKKPCLVASADGVGTKLQLAEYFQQYGEIGQDLVAMCVNDLICCGAHPLFFLDYYACAYLRQKPARAFLQGVLKACEESSCILLGGETAEMPGSYRGGHFDCAGFALGVVGQDQILGPHKVVAGDLLIGVSSSGFHSNGFSLLRKVFKKDLRQWKKELLKPTALYVSLAKDLFTVKGVKAMAHITGGGMDNIRRVLPQGTKPKMKTWEIPDIFIEVQKRARLSRASLLKTFNCGIGLVVVVSPRDGAKIKNIIKQHQFSALDLGQVVSSNKLNRQKK